MEGPDRQIRSLLESSGRSLHTLLMRLTLREDVAEDLFQELFLRLTRFRGFAAATDLRAYAHRVAINLAFTWHRVRKRRPAVGLSGAEPVSRDPLPLAGMIQAEQLREVLEAAGELPEAAREAFALRYIQEESYEAIALQFGKTPHQVRAICHKAIRRIRDEVNLRAARARVKERLHADD